MSVRKYFLGEGITKAAEQAVRMGLKNAGFGMYADPNTGKITYMVKNGVLVPVAKIQPKAEKADKLVAQNPDASFDKEGKMTPHAKQAQKLKDTADKQVDKFQADKDKQTDSAWKEKTAAQNQGLGQIAEQPKAFRISIGEFLGIGGKWLNAFAAKQNVKEFDTNNGKNPVHPIGDLTGQKREDVEQNYSNIIRTLDKMIEAAEIEKPMVAYRGLSQRNAEVILNDYENGGGVINLPAFTSLTLDQNVAGEFSEGVELIVTLPAGTKAMQIEPTSEDNDMELVLKRNTKIRIDKVEDHGDDQSVIYATVIAQ